ncbi:MAG: MFS transporter [Thermoleophilaceae bacterium]
MTASSAAENPRTAAGAPIREGAGPLAVLGWVLYDLANTIFAYAILTRYFNEWIIVEQGQPDIYVGLMTLGVAVVLLVTLPFFGALADRWHRRMPFLAAFTLLCVAATAALAVVDGVLPALLVAGLAIFAYNSALAHYDPLLSAVAPAERRGLVSGLGVGVGYVGVLLALAVLGDLVPTGDNQQAFLPTAVLFLLFSLPCFLWVRDRRGAPPANDAALPSIGPRALAGRVVASVRHAARERHGRLLLARFLYVDAIATVGAYMTVYARRTGDFPGASVDTLLAASIAFAIPGGLVAGVLVQRVGPKRVLTATLLLVAAALLLAGLSGSGAMLWVAGPAVGIALGAVWTSDRVFLVRLCPEERRGEAFGLYTLVGKASSGIGPVVLWGGTILLLSGSLGEYGASRVAVCLLAVAALGGLALLGPLSDEESVPAEPTHGGRPGHVPG